MKLLLCDDESLFRDSLSEVIRKWAWVSDVCTACTGDETLELLSNRPFDILLLDMNMPGSNGIEVAKVVHWKYPFTKIIMLTNHAGEALIQNLYWIGIHGFVLKNVRLGELEKIIQTVLAGERYFPDVIKRTIEDSKITKVPEIVIAPRHKQVLELLMKGEDPNRIASILHLSVNTINSYKSEMMKQTHTQSTPELIAFIRKNGLA